MAEQLIIHVKIDGFSPQKETGKGGRSATTAAADLRRSRALEIGNKASSSVARAESKNAGPANITGAQADLSSIREVKKGRYRSTYSVGMLDPEDSKSYLGDAEVTVFNREALIKDTKAAGAALAWKAADSAVKVAQHRSGDSYANAQLNNAMKIVGYGTAIVMSGPAAPFVAAGIAVNEIANGIVEGINYRFDRALEGDQIRNMKIIAGDVSYGRRRGAL